MNNKSQDVLQLIEMITHKVAPATDDREVTFAGMDLHIAAGVFDPSRSKSAIKMTSAINMLLPAPDDKLLEIGTGSGVLTIFTHLKTGLTDYTACDIDQRSVDCANQNFKAYNMAPVAFQSDLFSQVPIQSYDYIIFNAPTAHCSITPESAGVGPLWDVTGTLKQRFMSQARDFLSDTGKIVMMYSRYADYDSLQGVDTAGFDEHYLYVNKDEISESGVLVLTPAKTLGL